MLINIRVARAYFLSGSYDRAEAALEELIPSIDASADHVLSSHLNKISTLTFK
jgi:hypothetical protein